MFQTAILPPTFYLLIRADFLDSLLHTTLLFSLRKVLTLIPAIRFFVTLSSSKNYSYQDSAISVATRWNVPRIGRKGQSFGLLFPEARNLTWHHPEMPDPPSLMHLI